MRSIGRFKKLNRRRRTLLAMVGICVLLWAAAEWTLRSDWFQSQLETKLTAAVEDSLGGVATVDGVRFQRRSWTLAVSGLSWRTANDAEPLIEIPAAEISIGLGSLIGGRVTLPLLRLERPRIVLHTDSEGLPATDSTPIDRLIALELDLLEVDDGELIIDGEKRSFSLRAEGVDLDAQRDEQGDCYDGTTAVDKVTLEYGEHVPELAVATADWRLCRDRFTARSLRLETAQTVVRLEGAIEDFAAPRAEAVFEASSTVERWLPELGRGWRVHGPLTAQGRLSWSSTEQTVNYQVDLRGTSWTVEGPGGPAGSLNARARLDGNQDRLELNSVELSGLDGLVEASGEVQAPFGARRVRLAGTIAEIPLERLLQATSAGGGRAVPASPWSALFGGEFTVEGSRLGDLQATAALRFEHNPEAVKPALLGGLDAAYDGSLERVTVNGLELAAPGAAVTARGRVEGSGAAAIDLEFKADEPEQVETLLALLGRSLGDFPFTLRGGLELKGELETLAGRETAPSFDGVIRIGGLRLLNYEWEALAAEMTAEGGEVRLEHTRLIDGEGQAELTARLEPQPGVRIAEWPLSGEIQGGGLDVAKVVAATRLPLPVEGLLGGRATLGGSLAALEIAIDFSVSPAAFAGQSVEQIKGRALAAKGRIQVPTVEIRRGDSLIRGSGDYVRAERSFEFEMAGDNWELSSPELLEDFAVRPEGAVAFELNAVGALTPPPNDESYFDRLSLDGSWTVADLRLGGAALGRWSGTVESEADVVRLAWSGDPLAARAAGSAEFDAQTLAFEARAEFDGFAAEALIAAADLPLDGVTGELAGSAQIAGTLLDPASIRGEGVFEKLELQSAEIPGVESGYAVYNPFPMRWSYDSRALSLEHMRLQGAGTDIEIDGDILFADEAAGREQSLDLTVEGDFNLSALESLRPELSADGRSTVQVRIDGSTRDPQVRGRFEIRDATLRSRETAIGLSGLRGAITFAGRDVRLENMEAASGGGRVTLTGGGRIESDNYEFRFEGRAERVRLRYPNNVSSIIDGDLVLSGSEQQRLVSGEIVVQRMSTNPETTLGTLLQTLQQPTPAAPGESVFEDLQLNIHVASSPGMEIDTSLIRNIAADIDLRVVGSFANPALLGDVTVTRGQMNFHGSRYVINRGDIEFRNPVRIEPVLDFELETRIRAVDIALILSGPARKLNFSYRSDPPLSLSNLVNLVAVGRAPTTDPLQVSRQRVQQQSLFQTGANNVFTNAVQRPVSPGLQRFFGVSRLKVDPQVGGAEANPTARISTEQQITDEVTLIYTYDLSSAQQQTVRLEYAPDRRWTFVLTRDENGLVGSDILYKTRLP